MKNYIEDLKLKRSEDLKLKGKKKVKIMPNPISDTQLTAGTQLLIRGNVTYSRITSHIDGEELEKDKIRRSNRGWNPIEKPYTTITITNPRVIPKDTVNGLNLDEQYLAGKIYASKTNPSVMNYTINSKSPYLPSVAVARPGDPSHADQINPQGELDRGLDVTLVIRVFASRNHNGLSLDSVIVNEPIRYYSANNGYISEMANRGIIITPLPADQVNNKPVTADKMPLEDAGGEPQQTYAQVTSAPTGSAAFTANTANATVQQAQQQTAAPAMNPPETNVNGLNNPWTCACGKVNDGTQNFCGACGHPKPQPAQQQTAAPAQNPDSPWVCECGMHNAATQKFCGTCGKPRPVAGNMPTGNTGIVYDPQ